MKIIPQFVAKIKGINFAKYQNFDSFILRTGGKKINQLSNLSKLIYNIPQQ